MPELIAIDEELVELWNRVFPVGYSADLRLLRQIESEHPSATPAAHLGVRRHGRLVAFALARVGPEASNLDAVGVDPSLQRQGLGRRLMYAVAEQTGSRPLRFGGGPAHFVPGLPDEFKSVQGWFEGFGFQADWRAMDLRLPPEVECPPVHHPQMEFGPALPEEAEALIAFVEREFPGRWTRDTRLRIDAEGPSDIVVGRYQGRLEAFCHAFSRRNRWLGPSVFWRGALDSEYGGIGPVGVGESLRGLGAGLAVVRAALHHLRTLGARDIVVDWTTLEAFYRKAGFLPWRHYTGLLKRP